MKMHSLAPMVLATLTLVACAGPGGRRTGDTYPPTTDEILEPFILGNIQRLHHVAGIYLADQPSSADLEEAQRRGFRTVVNFRLRRESLSYDERAKVIELGMDYIPIPWSGSGDYDDYLIDTMRRIFSTADRPLLVHCDSGDRVGALWIPWRVLDQGVSLDQAVGEAKRIGLVGSDYAVRAKQYIAERQ